MSPRATYRLQFHKDFTFADAAARAGYFAALGISHVYASPIQTARAGSMHGYDVVDHATINPELGGEAGFEALAAALKAESVGLILDIVPNHMAVGGADNRWWLDVLGMGRDSQYAHHFDIDFDPPDPDLKDKILAPFLGAPYGEVLRSGDLKIVHDDALGLAAVAYHHHRFPLRPEDQTAGWVGQDLSADDLHAILERQNFRLAWWRTAGDAINWRRFFDVTELAGLRVEADDVFEAVHAIPLDLYARGLIDGVRVDHVDGLADPAAYCRKLRARLDGLQSQRPSDAAPGRAYLVIEKILGPGEQVSPDWQVDGTSGYDFMNEVSAVQHDEAGAEPLTALWTRISGRPGDFEAEEVPAREEVLLGSFDGQLEAAARALHRLAATSPDTRDLTQASLRRALVALIRHLRVYRSYATGVVGSPDIGSDFAGALGAAGKERGADEMALAFLGAAMTRPDGAEVARRINQLTAPVTAKSVEDTAFYRYGRLLSRNDVGFEAATLAMPTAEFHARMARRAGHEPLGMLTTATHDHKRGEDVRARLAVLSEMPDLWVKAVDGWFAMNAAQRPAGLAPDDECQLYQTLVGVWSLGLDASDSDGLKQLAERLAGWRLKSLREAKLRTSWTQPDEAYEAANEQFLGALLDPTRSAAFLAAIATFVAQIAPAGAMNSLVQTALRYTVPGVPDLYQGTEFWDLTLVDPDNRRPVDYEARTATLSEAADPVALSAHWPEAAVKQALIRDLLAAREADPDLFTHGQYKPLEVAGLRSAHVIAFARRHEKSSIAVLLAKTCAPALIGTKGVAPPAEWWGDTSVILPAGRWNKVIAPTLEPETTLRLADALTALPVAVFRQD